MVALALYKHKSIDEVLDDLGLAIPDSRTPFVSKSVAAQARVLGSYRELKQTKFGTALTLRSKTVDGVYQEK